MASLDWAKDAHGSPSAQTRNKSFRIDSPMCVVAAGRVRGWWRQAYSRFIVFYKESKVTGCDSRPSFLIEQLWRLTWTGEHSVFAADELGCVGERVLCWAW